MPAPDALVFAAVFAPMSPPVSAAAAALLLRRPRLRRRPMPVPAVLDIMLAWSVASPVLVFCMSGDRLALVLPLMSPVMSVLAAARRRARLRRRRLVLPPVFV